MTFVATGRERKGKRERDRKKEKEEKREREKEKAKRWNRSNTGTWRKGNTVYSHMARIRGVGRNCSTIQRMDRTLLGTPLPLLL